MNAFADWLFSTLFGWMGTAANSAWNAIVNTRGGISGLFSKYWLVFVLIIIISGTILDFAVWFARWRPYLVWRSWFRRNSKLRIHKRNAHDLEHTDMDDDTRSALADRVSSSQEMYLINSQDDSYTPYHNGLGFAEPFRESPIAFSPSEQDFSSPYVSQDFDNKQLDQNDYNPTKWFQNNADQFIDYQQPDVSQAGWNQDSYMPINEYQSQPGYNPSNDSFNQNIYNTFENSANSNIDPSYDYGQAYNQERYSEEILPVSIRRRRTERSKKSTATKNLFNHLKERIEQSENQETMLDGLPSPVRPEDAFHEPIYPQSYNYQYTDEKESKEQFYNHQR